MSVLEKGETCLPVKMYCKITILNSKFWEGMFKREGAYVYLGLIHVDVWQKPTQNCKAIMLQLKINEIKKKKNLNLSMKRGSPYRLTWVYVFTPREWRLRAALFLSKQRQEHHLSVGK